MLDIVLMIVLMIFGFILGAYVQSVVFAKVDSRRLGSKYSKMKTELEVAHNQIDSYRKYTKSLSDDILGVKEERDRYLDESDILEKKYIELKNRREYLYTRDSDMYRSESMVNKTTKQAVNQVIKKAMMNSHPDKGGSSSDFIAYKKLYDQWKEM